MKKSERLPIWVIFDERGAVYQIYSVRPDAPSPGMLVRKYVPATDVKAAVTRERERIATMCADPSWIIGIAVRVMQENKVDSMWAAPLGRQIAAGIAKETSK